MLNLSISPRFYLSTNPPINQALNLVFKVRGTKVPLFSPWLSPLLALMRSKGLKIGVSPGGVVMPPPSDLKVAASVHHNVSPDRTFFTVSTPFSA
jgi:hypothetical protein